MPFLNLQWFLGSNRPNCPQSTFACERSLRIQTASPPNPAQSINVSSLNGQSCISANKLEKMEEPSLLAPLPYQQRDASRLLTLCVCSECNYWAHMWIQNDEIAHLWQVNTEKHSRICYPSLSTVLTGNFGELWTEGFANKSPAQGSSRCHVAMYVFNPLKLCSFSLLTEKWASCARHYFKKTLLPWRGR